MAGLIIAALSQVSRVTGFGNSCSQLLFAVFAVADGRIGTEDNFERACVAAIADCALAWLAKSERSATEIAGKRRSRDQAVVQRSFPEGFEGLALLRPLALPVIVNEIVTGLSGIAREQRDDLVRRVAVVQRRDQRLDECSTVPS